MTKPTTTTLTLDAIMQAAKAPETTTVPVPEWGGSVTVKGFSRAELKALRKQCTHPKTVNGQTVETIDSDMLEEALFLNGLVEPKFTKDHWVELQNRADNGIETVMQAITKASSLGKQEAEDLRKSVPAESAD